MEQEGSAEHSLFSLFFGLVQRIDADRRVGYSTFFPDQVENVATGANNQRNFSISDFDRVVNGNGPGITWTKINPRVYNYLNALENVDFGIHYLTSETHSRAIRRSEIERLREFTQGVVEYRPRLPASDYRVKTIEMWEN